MPSDSKDGEEEKEERGEAKDDTDLSIVQKVAKVSWFFAVGYAREKK
jgi:hypothetical protein